MERRKSVSEKVRQAENSPVNWNKAMTWNKISESLGANKRKRIGYYYAAAVFVFVIGLTTYLFVDQHTSAPAGTPVKKTSGYSHAQIRGLNKPDGSDSVKYEIETSMKVPQSPLKISHRPAVINPVAEKHVEEKGLTSDSTSIVTVAIPEVIKPDSQAMKKKVQPIIGVVVEDELPVANEKRVKFRMRRSWQESDYQYAKGWEIHLSEKNKE